MPRNVVTVEQIKKHLTKKEKEQRKKAEERLKIAKDKLKPPNWLDEIAKKEFKRIVKEMDSIELLTNIDVAALAIVCDAYSKYVQASEAINKTNLLVKYTNKGGNTNYIENPYVKVATKYAEMYKKYCVEIGLTPASRLRMTVTQSEEIDEEKEKLKNMFGDI